MQPAAVQDFLCEPENYVVCVWGIFSSIYDKQKLCCKVYAHVSLSLQGLTGLTSKGRGVGKLVICLVKIYKLWRPSALLLMSREYRMIHSIMHLSWTDIVHLIFILKRTINPQVKSKYQNVIWSESSNKQVHSWMLNSQ